MTGIEVTELPAMAAVMDDFPLPPEPKPVEVAVVTGPQIEVASAISFLARYLVSLERVYLQEAINKLLAIK